jgi:hypothetical protein
MATLECEPDGSWDVPYRILGEVAPGVARQTGTAIEFIRPKFYSCRQRVVD